MPQLSLIWSVISLVAAEVWRLYWTEEPKMFQQVSSWFGESLRFLLPNSGCTWQVVHITACLWALFACMFFIYL